MDKLEIDSQSSIETSSVEQTSENTRTPLGYEISEVYEPDTNEWEVKKILDVRESKPIRMSHHVYRTTKEYLVHWKGYSKKDASWEPEHYLDNCQELLEEFYNNRNININ
ncbi:hypothetical protein KC19_4G242000 [Ceratodon purpureus]|uniref:Chromo domain-containing protein n=1 Tax=Ceratodon purpureus TaxID=3225 RepID=A0A8T0IEK0_CERPU|nr:hypothetical protein KC19_4G242000 [Ceratodon purpureus]